MKQVIEEAIRIIETGWTQGWFARDKDGVATEVSSPNACSWCLAGALILATNKFNYPWVRLCDFYNKHNSVSMGNYNDHPSRTKEDILRHLRDLGEKINAT